MQTVRFVTVVILVALFLAIGVTTVSADDPVANANPGGALYIDNQVHTIAANSSQWFNFDYALSDAGLTRLTMLKLLYGNRSGVGFEIFEPRDMNAYWDNDLKPVIGRGVAVENLCSTGWCEGDDLVWVGGLGATGKYFVRVTNNNNYATTALLTIEGKGVSLAPIAVTGVSPSAQISSPLDDPAKSSIMDGKIKIIPANSAIWYRFDYVVGDPGTPVKVVRLLYGDKSGLHFEVYSPEILNKWWNNTPIGKGMNEMVVCSTGLCKSNDLIWAGAFGASGTYYLRVINNLAYDLPALLTIQ